MKSISGEVSITEELIRNFVERYNKITQRSRYNSVLNSCLQFYYYLSSRKLPSNKPKIVYSYDLSIEKIKLIEDFLLTVVGCNHEKTIEKKRRCITKFLTEFPKDFSKKDNYSPDILGFISSKTPEDKAYIRSFLHYLFQKELINIDYSVLIHIQKRGRKLPTVYNNEEIQSITSEEINKLIEAADNNISYSRSANTKTFCFPMILRLLAFGGLRLNEALELEINDFYDEPGIIILHKTKNNRERVIPLHSSLSELLSLYKMKLLKIYPHSKYMFPDCTLKSTLTKGQIEYEFKKILSQVGFDNHHAKNERGICLHCFRHTFAVESFRKLKTEHGEIDNTIPILSTYLGHSRLNETEKYLKFSYDLFPEEAELFDDYCKDVFGGIL